MTRRAVRVSESSEMTFSAKLMIGVSKLCSKRIAYNVSRRSIALGSTSDNFAGERTKSYIQQRLNLGYDRNREKTNSSKFNSVIATQAMLFGLFGPDKSEEEDVPEFILNIKRSILMIRVNIMTAAIRSRRFSLSFKLIRSTFLLFRKENTTRPSKCFIWLFERLKRSRTTTR